MKIICKLPIPEGSQIIRHVKRDNQWHLVYLCPSDQIKIFIFDLETHDVIEVIHAEELWTSMQRPPESKL